MILRRQQVTVVDYNKERELTIEKAGRNCWQSEGKITHNSYVEFIRRLKKKKHFSCLEFCWICVRIVCDRALTHQLVRHRHFSYAQESQHYITYRDNVQFVVPTWLEDFPQELYDVPLSPTKLSQIKAVDTQGKITRPINSFLMACIKAETEYIGNIAKGMKAQEARFCLPNAAKTELFMAGNGRSWVEFLDKRLGIENVHPMQCLALEILDKTHTLYPTVLLESED